MAKAVADFTTVQVGPSGLYRLMHTPDGISDEIAAAIPTPGLTAAAALAAIGVTAEDTVLIGGAGGGVGVIAVQLARLAGARVIGTASTGTFDFLRQLGAEPVEYGPGLADRVLALAPDGITAATDLFGTEVAQNWHSRWVFRRSAFQRSPLAPPRQAGSARQAAPTPSRACWTGSPTRSSQGVITVRIAATVPIEQTGEAVALQSGRHVHGKVVITI